MITEMTIAQALSKYNKSNFKIHLDETKNYYECPKLIYPIEAAATGQTPNPANNINMDPHQRHIGYEICKIGLKKLKKSTKEINDCKDFRELFEITERVRKNTDGLGDLWSYDTALRIGFSFKKESMCPKEVYLHAGVTEGAKKILGEKYKKSVKEGRLLFDKIPKIIKTKLKEPYMIENFLCFVGKKDIVIIP